MNWGEVFDVSCFLWIFVYYLIMNNQTINVSSQIYDRAIRDAFISHAGEKEPDPESKKEV